MAPDNDKIFQIHKWQPNHIIFLYNKDHQIKLGALQVRYSKKMSCKSLTISPQCNNLSLGFDQLLLDLFAIHSLSCQQVLQFSVLVRHAETGVLFVFPSKQLFLEVL